MTQAGPRLVSPQGRVVPPDQAEERLREFGLTIEMVTSAIEVGDTARQRVSTSVYPKTFAGVTMWAETLAELRRQLLKRGRNYKIGRTGNYETVYSEERKIGFAVHAGDSLTGIQGWRDPRLTRPKGKKTRERVERNAKSGQLVLEIALPDGEDLPADEDCETWFLLLRPTRTEIRLEISCPRSISDDGIVAGWRTRILLPPLPISGAIAPFEPDDGDDSDDGEPLIER